MIHIFILYLGVACGIIWGIFETYFTRDQNYWDNIVIRHGNDPVYQHLGNPFK